MVVAGLVGYAAEHAGGDAEYVGARLTVDMIRMAGMGELRTSARLLREGRRLRLVDVEVEQNGKPVALGRAVFARRSDPPAGQVWSDPVAMPSPPTDEASRGYGPRAYSGDGREHENFDIWKDPAQEKYVWFNLAADLVEGEPMSNFVRAACVADVANPLTNWGSEGLQYVNSDVTMYLSRIPHGQTIGLAARDRQDADGVSVGTATMLDRLGPVGTCVVTALASEVPMQPPNRRD
jgi:acyl-coenzyme A thioesterase PaaI-like protein